MDLLFCHGLDTGPHGRKYHALTDAGLTVIAPDFQGMNLAARVAHLIPILGRFPAPVVVGSSYGGITAMCATLRHIEAGGRITGLLLCAPALARQEPPATEMGIWPPRGPNRRLDPGAREANRPPPAPTVIVHGLHDQVIPISVSRDFARAWPDQVELIEVDDDHGLAGSLDRIVAETRELMSLAQS